MAAIGAEQDLLPFEVHRVVEYLIGLGLVGLFIDDYAQRPVVGYAGLVVIALAATTRGRLGMLRWWPLGLHRVLDVAVVVAMVAVPFVPGAGGAWAALLLAPAAAILAVLTRYTRYRPATAIGTTPDRPPTLDAAAPGRLVPIDSPRNNPAGGDATGADASGPRPPRGGQGMEITARRLGRLAGRLVATARQGPGESTRGDQSKRSSTDDST